MQEQKIFSAQEFYEQHLSSINTVYFTNREIDVIACLIHARGTGKIAVLLSIDKRTAETHIRNIMSKLDCNTREAILDFVEVSSKVNFLRTYYIILQNELLFEKSIQLHKQYGTDQKRLARTLAHLGSVYRGRGFYQKAIENLEESRVLYAKHFPNDHFKKGWILTQLGNVYREIGDLGKAKKYLEDGLRIFQTKLPENHVDKGLVLAYLGNHFRDNGELEKSRDYLEHSLKIYQNHSHIEAYNALEVLGEI